MPSELQKKIEASLARLSSKVAFAPTGSMPPPDPAGGAMPPMDPAAMGGAPPMDPSMMGGGMPPMDPAMMGGAPPMDPAMMGGGMPPADPAAMGGMPPMDPAAMGGAPVPPGLQQGQDPMQMITDLNDKIDAVGDLLMKICRHFNISLAEDEEKGAESLVNDEELDKLGEQQAEDASAKEPLSDQAKEAIGGQGGDFIKQQLQGLGGGY